MDIFNINKGGVTGEIQSTPAGRVLRGESTLEDLERESETKASMSDYLKTMSSTTFAFDEPQVSPETYTEGSLDFEDKSFDNYFNSLPLEIQDTILDKADNNQDAMRIASRQLQVVESERRIANDSLPKELLYGLSASMLNPSSLVMAIPFVGGITKLGQLSEAATKLIYTGSRLKDFGVAGASAGLLNMGDEAFRGAEGLQTHYISAGAAGVLLGGGLQVISNQLGGLYKMNTADSLFSKDKDTYTKDFDTDPDVTLDLGKVEGEPVKVVPPKMTKTLIEKVPGIQKLFASDLSKLYQSDNPAIRWAASRLSAPTVALKDTKGDYVPVSKNGVDYKKSLDGIRNTWQGDYSGIFKKMKKDPNAPRMSYKDFSKQVYTTHVQESNRLANKAYDEFNDTFTTMKKASKEAIRAENRKIRMSLLGFKDKGNKKVEGTLDKIGEEYKRAVSPEEYNPEADLEAMLAKISPERFTTIRPKAKEIKEAEKEATERLEREYQEWRMKMLDKFYAENKREFKGNKYVNEAAERTSKYFDDMLKQGHNLKIKELADIRTGRLYTTRQYNLQALKDNTLNRDQVEDLIREGLKGIKANRNILKNAGTLNKTVSNLTDKLYDMASSKDITTSFMHSKELPFDTYLKSRKVKLDESKMGDLIVNDISDIIGRYHYKMAGRYSVHYAFGTDDLTEVTKMVKEQAKASGNAIVDPEEFKALGRTVEDLLGTLRMNALSGTPKWSFTRNLMTYNSLRAGGRFGINQAIELMGIASMHLVKGQLLKSNKSFKEVSDILYRETTPNDGFNRFLLNSGYLETALRTDKINRYADTELGFNAGTFERVLQKGSDIQMKANGMRYLTAVSESLVGGAVVDYLKKGTATPKMLARWGITKDDAFNLANALNTHCNEGRWDIDKLEEPLRDKLQLAISRGVSEYVVQGDSIHVPYWMKDAGAGTKLLTQFLRFPLIANEVLLRRGLTQEQAEFAVGILGSVIGGVTLNYFREQAAVNLGLIKERDRKYDYSDPDQLKGSIIQALNYSANLGLLTTGINYSGIALGYGEMGSDWQSKGIGGLAGINYSTVDTTVRLIQDFASGDGIDNERDEKRIRGLIPFMSLPLIKESADYLIER